MSLLRNHFALLLLFSTERDEVKSETFFCPEATRRGEEFDWSSILDHF